MPRRLLVVNVLLAGVSVSCLAIIALQFAGPAGPPARPRPAAAPPAQVASPPQAPRPPASAYGLIANRNVFSPARSVTPVTAASGPAADAIKLNLHGVMLRDTIPIAYLEDPLTKRVAGYRVGDQIAGGTVQTIAADRVVIARPEGTVDVRLRDPSKPRPPAPAPAAAPGAPAVPGAPTVAPPPGAAPGVPPALVPPRLQTQPPRAQTPLPQVQAPAALPQLGPFVPGRRPSPSLGSRLPPARPSDAQPQR